MATVCIGAAANIVLDPIFIYLFDMGVQGRRLPPSFLSSFPPRGC